MSMEYRTVQLELTNPKDNITDLMNILAIVSFRANIPRNVMKANFNRVVDEQYLHALLKAPIEPLTLQKPPELS